MTQPFGEPVPDVTLPLLGGGARSLASFVEGRRGAAVVFWSGVCSHCARYDGYLNSFAMRHPELALVAVAAREGETPERLAAVVAERGLAFPVLLDADRAVAHRFLVAQTPRAFLLDGERRLVYRGAIDDFKGGFDPERRQWLEEAIAALLAGRPVPRAETQSFGCPIESVYYGLSKPL